MSVYILIHGGSVDGTIWDKVKALLEARGDTVFAPSLSDEKTSNLSDYLAQVCSIIEDNNLSNVILVGHSFGGMVITGVADRMTAKINRMIYLDAALPEPGQSLFDVFRSGGFDPLRFKGLNPYPPYIEQLNFNAETLAKIPKIYIHCTESSFKKVAQMDMDRVKPREKTDNWTFLELPSDHAPMISMADALVTML